MRKWINLVSESQDKIHTLSERVIYSVFPAIDQSLISRVQDYLEEHLGDWREDFDDIEHISYSLEHAMDKIYNSCVTGSNFEIYRAERRAVGEIKEPLNSVGSCWTWDADSAEVIHGDEHIYYTNGSETVDIILTASVTSRDIDWIQTLAKNLVLKKEREISLLGDAKITVSEMWGKGAYSGSFETIVYSSGEF